MSRRIRRLLIAEDDAAQRIGLTDFFEMSGYEVSAVASGTEMLEAMARMVDGESLRPDLIITDIQMPGFTGVNVIEGMRAGGWSEPIIVITGFSQRRAVLDRLGELEDVVLMAKPFDPEALAGLVYQLTA